EQIGGASANIDHERRIGHIAVVITKGVVECHVRDPDHSWSKPRRFHRGIDSFEQIRFDRDQDDLQLLIRPTTDELIIPNHFVNRERHVLLRFKSNNALDFFLFHRRQFHESRENRLSCDRVVHARAFYPELVQYFANRGGDLCVPNRLTRILDREIAPLVIGQHQTTATLRAKISYRDRLRSEVKGKNASWPGHELKIPNPKSQIPRKSQAPILKQIRLRGASPYQKIIARILVGRDSVEPSNPPRICKVQIPKPKS